MDSALLATDGSLSRYKSSDGNTERRAGDVIQSAPAGGLEELDGQGVTTMLTTDAELELRLAGTALANRDVDELADAIEVDGLEGISFEDPLRDVLGKEDTCIITAVAEGHLREVVRAEGEEVGMFGDFIGGDRGAWDLDHGADGDVELAGVLLRRPHFGDGRLGEFAKHLKLL